VSKRKKSKPNQAPYERLGIVTIDEVLAVKDQETYVFLGEQVKLTSLRMQTFLHKGTVCSACGREAAYFAVERHWSRQEGHSNTYHLNLYGLGVEENEILYTHDHTIARALGGKDQISNTETMCSHCNNSKSVCENKIAQLNEWYKKNGKSLRIAIVNE